MSKLEEKIIVGALGLVSGMALGFVIAFVVRLCID